MTDNDHRERRRKQANAIRIRMSPVRMPYAEFNKHFRERHILADVKARDEVERITQELFCDECLVHDAHRAVLVHVLHSTIEDDPLRNFWKLCTLRCFNCGFEEIVPLDAPVFDPKDFFNEIKPGAIHRTTATEIMSDHYEREFHRQMEEYQRKQAIASQQTQAQMQQQKLQAMKTLYQQNMIDRAELQRALSQEMNINLSNAMKLGGGLVNSAFDGYSLSNPPTDPKERKDWMDRLKQYMGRK